MRYIVAIYVILIVCAICVVGLNLIGDTDLVDNYIEDLDIPFKIISVDVVERFDAVQDYSMSDRIHTENETCNDINLMLNSGWQSEPLMLLAYNPSVLDERNNFDNEILECIKEHSVLWQFTYGGTPPDYELKIYCPEDNVIYYKRKVS